MKQSFKPKKSDCISCSVIIRTKDRPQLLSRSLISLTEQERKPDEVIIVNDGGESIDQVVETFFDLPIVKIDNPANLGRSRAGNIAVEAAKGDAVCFLDDDDCFFPDHLKRLELSMVKFDAKVAYSGSILVKQDLLGEKEPEQNRVIGEFNDSFDPERLKFENYIPLITLMINRSLFLEVGGFDESFNLFEDWDLLLHLSKKTKFYHLNRITTQYAVWGSSQQITLSSDKGSWKDAYERLFKKHFLPLSGKEKTCLMAEYWLMSQERRSRIQTMTQRLSEEEETKRLNENKTEKIQKRLSELEKENEFLHIERQRLGDQNEYLNRELGKVSKQNEEIEKNYISIDELNDQKIRVNALQKMVHEQSKQLTVGLSSNHIQGLMQARVYSQKDLSFGDVKENYQRLAAWVKLQNDQFSEKVFSLQEIYRAVRKESLSLESEVNALCKGLKTSRLRKFLVPHQHIDALALRSKELNRLLAGNGFNSLFAHANLMLSGKDSDKNINTDQKIATSIHEYCPLIVAHAGNGADSRVMKKLDRDDERIPVPLVQGEKVCFKLQSSLNNFCGLDFKLATYVRINTCEIQISIFEESSGQEKDSCRDPLRLIRFNALDVLDNQWHGVTFAPIEKSAGKMYSIEIYSPNATNEEHIAVWCLPVNSSFDSKIGYKNQSVDVSHIEWDQYPWMKKFFYENQLTPCLYKKEKADHIFLVHVPSWGEGLLPFFLLQLDQMISTESVDAQIVLYGNGEPDDSVISYCEKNQIELLIVDEQSQEYSTNLPWILQWAKRNCLDQLIWLVQMNWRFENNVVQHVEEIFEHTDDIGMVIPMLVNNENRIVYAYAQMTCEGKINRFPAGMAANHPHHGYCRKVDAADSSVFVIGSSSLDLLDFNILGRYVSPFYQITELIWQLKQHNLLTLFDPAVCFCSLGIKDEKNEQEIEDPSRDRLCFYNLRAEQIKNKPLVYDDFSTLLNPEVQKTALIIDQTLPTFDEDSGSLRMYELIKIWIQLGIKVTFFPDNLENRAKYRRALEVLGVEVFCGEYGISDAMSGRQYDIIMVSRVDPGHRYLNMIKLLNPDARIYYDTVDIHYVREFRQAEIEHNDGLKTTAVKTRQKELSNCILADAVFTVTDEDSKHLKSEIPRLNCFVLPNIHRHNNNIHGCSYEHSSDLVFIGNYNHTPNQDAVFYFVEKVFPLIQSRIPDIKFYLIGSYMPDSMKALASDHIRVLGWVEEVEPELVKRRVFVSYLRYGAGMKGKIGQAMSLGLPVVSTPLGAEGMGLKDGGTVLIADDPETFAKKVVLAYTDKALWEKISENSKQYIDTQYGPEAVKQRMKTFFDKDLKLNQ